MEGNFCVILPINVTKVSRITASGPAKEKFTKIFPISIRSFHELENFVESCCCGKYFRAFVVSEDFFFTQVKMLQKFIKHVFLQ